jgi:hypothetical protein
MSRTQETAAQLDHAIDSIIGDGRGPVSTDEGELVATARLLRRALPRLHPSFGFEELLAARLAAARRMELAPAGAGGTVVAPTPIRPGLAPEPPAGPARPEGPDHRRRNLVAGGAIASGVSLALPIAGAAIVVWRRTRSSGGMF